MENNELDILYRKIENVTEGEDPLMAAGVMMAQALRIYKIMLDTKEFENVVSYISETAADIEVGKSPGRSLH
jgi:hypothetical protein|tara:strand:+ start:793 stop:1008 length:216 start_codon:yes stop_codon:yes gene_type:complete